MHGSRIVLVFKDFDPWRNFKFLCLECMNAIQLAVRVDQVVNSDVVLGFEHSYA
jgi:hypothetical protein